MVTWFESLSGIEQVFAVFAIPATLLMLIQTLLLLLGLGGSGEADTPSDTSGIGDSFDGEMDGGFDDAAVDFDDGNMDSLEDPTQSGLRLFTLRGIVAFLAVFGWSGLAISRGGGSYGASIAVSVIAGFAALIALAFMMRGIMKLQESGNIDERSAIGCSGNVYLKIPPGRTGKGKITVLLQSRLVEFDAVTDDTDSIPTGREITVVDITGRSTMVVRKK